MPAPLTTAGSTMGDDVTRENHNTAKFAPVRAIMTIAREFDKVARDLDVSVVQYRFMLYLKDGPRRAGEVAATSLVTRATISGHIAALREKGWITAEAEAFDRRITRLLLTDSGRAAMEAFEAALLESLSSLMDQGNRDRMLEALSELYRALSATRETRYLDFESPDYKFVPPSGTK
jgi:DNA-binding MarR family transcriptional regulator